ncbi:MAG: ABC transporter ATP-binding protein [Clostridia bacterium]|nr:ABC transporter ATP-binding protein [Clostridia bacterium]
MSYISLKGVNKKYGKGVNEFYALKDINLEIEKGDMLCIMGASGSGKSTLLNIIGTIAKPTDGTYQLNEEDVLKMSGRKIANLRNNVFGFVVQNFALIDNYTIKQNIEIPLIYASIPLKKRNTRINELLKLLEIEEQRDKLPCELSGGQCQRVAIARALANNPEIILADEPTGALDKKTGEIIIDLFDKLNKSGITIIIVTHNEEIAKRCNRVIHIEDGKFSM